MIDRKSVLAVTLARGGSKSVPYKNIVEINGRPLIDYTFSAVAGSKFIDKYIVSTDDPKIASFAESRQVEVPFLRPKELSGDAAKSSDALLHAVEYMEGQGLFFDFVVEVMATNPLKKSEDIDGCISLLNESSADFAVACHQIHDHHPSRVKFLSDGFLKSFYPEVPESRRQDLTPPAYVRSGSIYAMRTESLKKYRSRYNESQTAAYILPPDRVINIDEPQDLELARFLLGEKA